MAFHDLASLPPAAVEAVAQTCEALISAEGQEKATPRERQLLATLFPALLGQPWPTQPPPAPGGDATADAAGLSGAAARSGQGAAAGAHRR